MSNQFKLHPTIDYNGREIRDFTRNARIFAKIREDDSICADYIVEEGETPMQLAQDFYGNPELYWVLLNLNDVVNPWFDWPMDYNTLIRYTISKYGLVDEDSLYYDPNFQTSGGTEPAFFGFDEFWFPRDRLFEALLMYPQFTTEEEFKNAANPMSYLEYEGMLNDERRYIRVIRPDEITNVINDYRDEVRA